MITEHSQADIAHREYLASLLLGQAEVERGLRNELTRAEERKELLMSRLAQLDLGLVSSSDHIMDRVVYTVGDYCTTVDGREELSNLLEHMDPEGMVTLEIVGWCRTGYPFREVLPSYGGFVRRAWTALQNRLDPGQADSLLRGLL